VGPRAGRPQPEGVAIKRTDTRGAFGFRAAFPCRPRPDTRHRARRRGDGERRHRDRPL